MSVPAWEPEQALGFAQAHVEAGPFNGCFMACMGRDIAVVPCMASKPAAVLAMMGLQIMAGAMDSPDWLLFMADTYHAVTREGEDRESLPLSLEEAFRSGDERVSEAIAALCVSPDGPSYQATQLYVRGEDGKIEWGEVLTQLGTDGLGGQITELMVAVLATPYGAVPEAADGLCIKRQEIRFDE